MTQDSDPATGLPIGAPVTPADPAPRPERTTLRGRFVTLVPLDAAAHGPALAAGAVGPGTEALWLYMSRGPFADAAAFQDYLSASEASADPLFFTILDARSGQALGHATLMRIDPANRTIEVGNILYTPALQRTPGATEAMRLLAGYAFDLGYRRYEWKCNALNAPSRAAAARLGFTFEGLFRQAMIVKGRNRDTAWFSMLDGEWPQVGQALDRWLAPENFSGEGTQRLRLSGLTAAAIPGHRLRRATRADLAALGALQGAAYAPNRALLGVEPLPLLTPPETLLARYEVWLRHEGESLAGALILDPRPDHLLVWSIAVDPAHQGRRLGTSLLEAVEARAKDLDLRDLRLYTGERLARAIGWYARHGWKTERVEARPDRRLVHMAKHLA
ncbi:GNAT family N-acetyltransferase [Methylobacterium nodulans]|uniref:GCN5-related N-acetyltransferase n=1 Tax=Methylobacterium nodulans (strain LMG 21967 / CNCM I-2342 / ORS 2060) TaxID=460265 RepID=B8ILP1_METNO|nr:GNAT family N-acetyltransferase [Methylobacterium nodulans]ACL62016.1 GCN5-related N-acetyltransferase [Methylobacterium nodulans ORS 2060]